MTASGAAGDQNAKSESMPNGVLARGGRQLVVNDAASDGLPAEALVGSWPPGESSHYWSVRAERRS